MTSKQQQIILEQLSKQHNHPTADQIYHIVKQQVPNISLGTVYRNLNQLADQGKIIKLGKAGQQQRFDAYLEKHYHFACSQCNQIYDLPITTLSALNEVMQEIQEHEVQGYELEFFGICAKCKQQEINNET